MDGWMDGWMDAINNGMGFGALFCSGKPLGRGLCASLSTCALVQRTNQTTNKIKRNKTKQYAVSTKYGVVVVVRMYVYMGQGLERGNNIIIIIIIIIIEFITTLLTCTEIFGRRCH